MSRTVRNTDGAEFKYFRHPKTFNFNRQIVASHDAISEHFPNLAGSRPVPHPTAYDDISFSNEVYAQRRRRRNQANQEEE